MDQMTTPRVLVIGLDGATWDLLDRWMNCSLPNLSKLVRTGSSGVLESVFPPVTATAFASLMTGKKPANHGILDFETMEESRATRKVATPSQLDGEPFWIALSRAGLKVGVVHVPFTPVTPVNGFIVAGHPLGTRLVTYPDSLADRIRNEIKDYESLLSDLVLVKKISGMENLQIKSYMKALEIEAATTLYLMRTHPWDFLITHFYFGDQFQHFFWQYLETPSAPKILREAIFHYYERLDTIIGQIIETAGSNTTTFVFSDHGFGQAKKQVYLNHWLIKQGYLRLKTKRKRSALPTRETLFQFASSRLGRHLARAIPRAVARRIFWHLPPTQNPGIEDIDFPKSIAYSFGNVGQIFLNVKGRDPEGAVEPGPEYQHYRTRISSELSALRDPDTNEPIADKVYTKEELFTGKYSDLAPDLAVVMRDMSYLAIMDEFGSEFGPDLDVLFGRPGGENQPLSGWHRINGIVIACGPSIRNAYHHTGARIIDLAPTILHLMRVSLPETVDGQVLLEIFEPQSDPARRSPIKELMTSKAVNIGRQLDSEEELKEKLRALGYLG